MIWKQSLSAIFDMPELFNCGWTVEGEICWIENAFPSELEDILFDPDYEEDAFETDGEGESEEDI